MTAHSIRRNNRVEHCILCAIVNNPGMVQSLDCNVGQPRDRREVYSPWDYLTMPDFANSGKGNAEQDRWRYCP